MINQLYYLRSKFIHAKQYDSILAIKYRIRSILGYLRGLRACLSGKIIIDKEHRYPLIVGHKTKLIIRPGCAIILESEKCKRDTEIFHNNPIFSNATTIGLAPHFFCFDPPTNGITCIDLDNDSRLIMGINTIILPGSYITANHHAKISIGENSYISQEVVINARSSVKIGKNVMLGQQVRIMDYDAHDIFSLQEHTLKEVINSSRSIIIQDNVWVGFRATILKGVTIGSGSIVAANACVTSNVPNNVIVAGNPAKIVKENVSWER